MSLAHDIRIGLRAIRNAPGFAVTAMVTMALGIGATTAVFSVADAMLWKPIPLPHLETLAVVLGRVPDDPRDWTDTTPADVADIRRESASFSSFASWDTGLANIAGPGGEPERVEQALVTANFFDVLGVQPQRGRGFQPGEDQPGREREVVLSDALWKRRFGGDPGLIGKSIRLDDQDYTVAGVMPSKVVFPVATELWTPLALTPQEWSSRRSQRLGSLARLKPGVSFEQASAELNGIAVRLEQIYPDTNKNRRFAAISSHRFIVGEYNHDYVLLLLGAVLFVLLIACVNVANLQFARGTGRLREVAVRTALGAGRWRIVSQLVTECVLLSLGGAALGLAVAEWGLNLIRGGMPAEIEKYIIGWKEIHLDARTLAFTFGAALLSGIVSGLAPAWQSSRPNLTESLKEGGRGSSAGRARHRLRHILVAAEIALAVVLLAGAGLMVRGFGHLLNGSTPLEPETLLTLRLAITETRYKENHQVTGFYRDVLDRLNALPGVHPAVAVTALPYSGHSSGRYFTIEGRIPEPGRQPTAMLQAASPAYFAALHIPLRAGRLLADSDGADSPRVAVISQRLAQRWFPGEPLPLGKRIKLGAADAKNPWITIAGVAGDVTHDVFDRAPRAVLYVPYAQSPNRFMDIGIRTAGDPMRLVPAVSAAIRSVDAEQPITEVRTLLTAMHHQATGLTYVAVMMGIFGVLALVLAAVGVYGVMSYLVSEQTHEIGIRMALGAPRTTVLHMLFRRGLLTAAAGLACGLPVAFFFARLLASLIFGVDAADAVTFIGIPAALLLAAAIAIYVPARRAMRIDPIVALRYE
jgi:putative ABC transport system permease protein